MGTVVQHLVNGISCMYSTVVVLYIRDSFPSNHYIPVYYYTVCLYGTSYVLIFGRKNFEENSSRNVRVPKFQTVLFPILTINTCIVIKCVFNFIFTY